MRQNTICWFLLLRDRVSKNSNWTIGPELPAIVYDRDNSNSWHHEAQKVITSSDEYSENICTECNLLQKNRTAKNLRNFLENSLDTRIQKSPKKSWIVFEIKLETWLNRDLLWFPLNWFHVGMCYEIGRRRQFCVCRRSVLVISIPKTWCDFIPKYSSLTKSLEYCIESRFNIKSPLFIE